MTESRVLPSRSERDGDEDEGDRAARRRTRAVVGLMYLGANWLTASFPLLELSRLTFSLFLGMA